MSNYAPPKRTTIADIARALNLSAASVAMALSGQGGNTRVGDATRHRVLQMAQRMNYRSNSSARAMRSRRFNNIGFVAVRKSSKDYGFYEQTLEGISTAAARHGQNVILVQISEQSDSHEIPKALREACLDALVVENVSNIQPEFRAAVESSCIPVVYLNEKKPVNAVFVDDILAGRLMTGHLVSQGFRRIAMLAPNRNRNHYSTADRIQGYVETMHAAGLEPAIMRFDNQPWMPATEEWLLRQPRPEAIFCVGDQIALSLQRILYKLRIRVPEDLALAGCNGEMIATYSMIPLTTLYIPFSEMAEAAAEMAIHLAKEGAPKTMPSVCLKPELVPDVSTQRPTENHPD